MIVPIWVADEELDCCQPEVAVGSRWGGLVTFTPLAAPGGQDGLAEHRTDEQRVLGTVEFDIVRELAPTGGSTALSAGPLRFLGPSDIEDGSHTGKLSVNAHSEEEFPPAIDPIGGVVVAIDLIPTRYETRDQELYLPVAQLDPQRVQSTLARRGISRLPRGDGESMVLCNLIVWVDTDS